MEEDNGPYTLKKGQDLRGKKWKTEALLCLDGGGTRGYASVLMLEKLMEKIRDIEVEMGLADVPDHYLEMYPCHYFDYFYGTSTGGLISIMLGRLRMSLRDVKCAYTTMSKDIFDKEKYHRGLKGALPHVTASWELTGLENSIKTSVADSVERLVDGDVRSPDQRLNAIAPEHRELFTYMPSPSDLCRVGVLSYLKEDNLILLRLMLGSESTVIFRNFKIPDVAAGGILDTQPIPFDMVPILSASRATTAAPGYFPAMEIMTTKTVDGLMQTVTLKFLDGGAGTNNPTRRAFVEVQQLRIGEAKTNGAWPITGLYVVSIGTGMPLKEDPEHMKEKKSWKFVEKIKNKVPEPLRRGITDTEAVHKWMATETESGLDADHYFRFNVGRGLHELPMDQFKPPNPNARDGPYGYEFMGMQRFMEHHVNEAFVDANLGAQLDKLARSLAEMRRQRIEDQAMWDRVVKTWTLHECKGEKVNTCLHRQELADVLRYTHFDNLFTTREEAWKHACAAHRIRPEDRKDPRVMDEFLTIVNPLQASCAW